VKNKEIENKSYCPLTNKWIKQDILCLLCNKKCELKIEKIKKHNESIKRYLGG
jgi:hypothetical protein